MLRSSCGGAGWWRLFASLIGVLVGLGLSLRLGRLVLSCRFRDRFAFA
jgi:hypothetical protein